MSERDDMTEDAPDARKRAPWLVPLAVGLLAAGAIYISIATDTNLSWLFRLFSLFTR
jgi:hypothetical protein